MAKQKYVRRTCRQCSHEWTLPESLAKAHPWQTMATAGSVLGVQVQMQKGNIATCSSCGSVADFEQVRETRPSKRQAKRQSKRNAGGKESRHLTRRAVGLTVAGAQFAAKKVKEGREEKDSDDQPPGSDGL